MAPIDPKTPPNIAAGALAGLGWTGLLCSFALRLYWLRVAPTSPHPQRGVIYPHNEHGSITYFTAFQSTSCDLLFLVSPLLFIVGFALLPKRNVKTRSGKLWWSTRFDADDPQKVLLWSELGGGILALLLIFTVGPSVVHLINQMGAILNFG